MAGELDISLVAAYVADILDRARTLEDLARDSAAQDFVSDEAPSLIRAFERIGKALRQSAVGQWREYETTQSNADHLLLRGVDLAVRQLAAELRMPASATMQRVPGVLTRLVSTRAATLVKGAGVILRPVWNYNYKIQRQDVHALYTRLLAQALPDPKAVESLLQGVQKPLYIISFPAVERSAIHIHSVIGHELGHLMADQFVEPSGSFDAFLASEKKKLEPREGGQMPLPLPNAYLKLATASRALAIRELAADLGSVLLFGISSVFGATQVALSRNQDPTEEETYPLWKARISEMLRLADETGWTDFSTVKSPSRELTNATTLVKSRLDAIRAWAGPDASKHQHPNPWVAAGHKSALDLVPEIKTQLVTKFKSSLSSSSTTFEHLPPLFERLRLNIPPDSTSEDSTKNSPASLEDIFAVSWWFRIGNIPLQFEADDLDSKSKDASDKLKRLTLKAIENVDIVSRFERRLK